MQDWELLQQFVEHGSQTAFSRLVDRHLNMVYSTCLREIGDATLAEDATQVVFLLLSQKAKTLHSDTVLAGWLFQTARYAGRNARRQEESRLQREQRIAEQMMVDAENSAASDAKVWLEIEPLLNEAMGELSAADRNAVLLRCFEGYSLRETGLALGLSEDATGKRVARALEKLRRHFTKRRITLSLAALAALLSNHAVQAAPASCATAVLATGLNAPHALGIKADLLSHGMSRPLQVRKMKIIGALVCAAIVFEAGSIQLARKWAPPNTEPAQNTVLMRDIQNSPTRMNNKEEDMKMNKKFGTAVAGAAIATAMSASAFAADINAHVKSVDPAAHIITVEEGGKAIDFTVTAATKYLDAQDREIKPEGDIDPLERGVKAGILTLGTRLSIKYETKDAAQIASIVKLRDFRK